MDDFLHNLRSGKLKQPDRSNRSFNDQQYKGGPRRPMMDRRKRDYENKDTLERLNIFKEVLESIAESQRRLVKASESRNKTEERKARAMEVLAKNLYMMLNPKAENADFLFAADAQVQESPEPAAQIPVESLENGEVSSRDEIMPPGTAFEGASETVQAPEEEVAEDQEVPPNGNKPSKLTILDRQTLVPVISRLREKGESWERIARHIADQGYPTLSGKGIWRGVMVKNLYEKMSS